MTVNIAEIEKIYTQPFNDLIFKAQTIHRENFDANSIQPSTLLSIKTGACPEDCGYCSQSVHHNSGLKREPLMPLEDVKKAVKSAKENGASRFCMGAGWRSPPTQTQFNKVLDMVKAVKEEGLEACVTLGMLNDDQAKALKEAGLDFYNHNLDTSPEYYKKVTSTRTYDDRLDTLRAIREAGLNTCCGGIMGMGETREDRLSFLHELTKLEEAPGSIPINQLVPIEGTPLGNSKPLSPIEFVRTIATARILFPKSYVRLSAGRLNMSDALQALCFLAGANSIFQGDLLTTDNKTVDQDQILFDELGLKKESPTHANA